eukprot:371703_1
MAEMQHDALIDHIKSTQSIGDLNLMALLAIIPFSEIQTFLEQQISELNEDSIRKAYFTTLSIDDTLPSDVIGHVLSFHPFPHNAAINETNKMWNKCSAQIKTMQIKERKQEIANYDINYNEEVNNTWIVDPNRTQLTREETAASYKGPISVLNTAIERCESGDKLLIYDGVYEPVSNIHKSIQIIGVGGNVVFEHTCNNTSLSFGNGSISYVENIRFVADIPLQYQDFNNHINIEGGRTKVTVNKCTFFQGNDGILCANGACLDVKNCEFINNCIGILAEPNAANINVIGCVFEKCGLMKERLKCSSVSVTYKYCDFTIPYTLQLSCIGNLFRNNLFYSFSEKYGSIQLKYGTIQPDRYVLRCNMLEGDCGMAIDGVVVDTNKMYRQFH